VNNKLESSDFALIQKLVNTPGLPGRESMVAEVIKAALPKAGWESHIDAIGNLTARKPGPGKRIMFIAHLDEVGLIVRRITPQGFLKVERLGGINLLTLPGSAFDLWTDYGRIDAHVGAQAAHLTNGKSHPLIIEDLFIDIGASSKQDVLSMGVRIGDGLTWSSDLCMLPGDRIRGKALDDRLGCFALIKLAEFIDHANTHFDIVLSFVVQEESMILESAPVIEQYEPDIVIGIDGTLPFDTPDIDESQSDISLGEGPCIKLMDSIRGKTSYIPSWSLTRAIMRFMEEQGFSYQPEIVVGLSTALSLVPFMNKGIRTACISLPIRYHHSPVEVADLNDLENMITLLKNLLIVDLFTQVN
jgi:endoglucanase